MSINYNPDDVLRVAEFVIGTTLSCDQSGSRGLDGLMYCESCGVYEDNKGEVKHGHECITKIAEDLLNSGS